MKVLVTGGNGKIGRCVVEELKKSYEVRATDVKPDFDDSEVEFIQADLRCTKAMLEVTKGIDAVVHLGAIPTYMPDVQPSEYMKVNVTGTFNVLEAAARNSVEKVAIASSDSSLGYVFSTHHIPRYY